MAFKTTYTRYGKITFEDESAYNKFMDEERKRHEEMYRPSATTQAQPSGLYDEIAGHYKGLATGQKDPLYEIQSKQLSTDIGSRTSAGANVLMQNIGEVRGKSGLYGSRISQFQTEAAREGTKAATGLQEQKVQRAESAWDKLSALEKEDYGRWRTSYEDALQSRDWRTANMLWGQGTQKGFVKGTAPQYKEIMGPSEKELYATKERKETISDLETRLSTALTRGDSGTAKAIHAQLQNMGVQGFTEDIPDYQVMLDRNYAMQNPQMYLDSGNPSLIAKWYNLTGTKVVDKQSGQLRDAAAADFKADEPDDELLQNYVTTYTRFLTSNGFGVDKTTGNITGEGGNIVGNVNQMANTHLAYDNGLAARPPQLPGETDEAYAKRMEVFGISGEDIRQTPAPTAAPAPTATTPAPAPAPTPAQAATYTTERFVSEIWGADPGDPAQKLAFLESNQAGQTVTSHKGTRTWQKQADGTWKEITGQSTQPAQSTAYQSFVEGNTEYVRKADGTSEKMSEYEKSPDFANDPRFKDKKANEYVTIGDTTWVKQKSGVWKEGEPLSFDPTTDDAWGTEAKSVLDAGRDAVPDLYDTVLKARVDEMFTSGNFTNVYRKDVKDPTYKTALDRAKSFENKSNEEWRGSARNTYYNFATQVQNGDVINYGGKLYVVTSGLSRQYDNVAWTTRDREYQKFEAFDVTANKRVTFYARTGGKIEVV